MTRRTIRVLGLAGIVLVLCLIGYIAVGITPSP